MLWIYHLTKSLHTYKLGRLLLAVNVLRVRKNLILRQVSLQKTRSIRLLLVRILGVGLHTENVPSYAIKNLWNVFTRLVDRTNKETERRVRLVDSLNELPFLLHLAHGTLNYPVPLFRLPYFARKTRSS